LAPAQVTEKEEEGNVARLARQHGAADRVDKQPCSGGSGMRAFPGLQCHRVPLVRVWSEPRSVRRNLSSKLLPATIGAKKFPLRKERKPRQVARVSGDLATPAEQLAAGVELRKPFDAEFLGQRG